MHNILQHIIHNAKIYYIYIRSYVILQCEGPPELRASKCAFRKAFIQVPVALNTVFLKLTERKENIDLHEGGRLAFW